MNENIQVEDMKVYRPKGNFLWISYVGMGISILMAIIFGIQNINLRNEIKNREEKEVVVSNPVKTVENPPTETFSLNQANPTENWRIYKNLTYSYKFRVPKTYNAKVNNSTNSVEIFNEGSQKVMEIIAEPKSSSNSSSNSENKIKLGNIEYDIEEFPDGNQTIKSPFSLYKTSSDAYVFSLFFYNSLSLNEMEKLILSTFYTSL